MKYTVITKLDDVLPELPEILPFEAARRVVDPAKEVFLCVLGFEPRCLSIPERLAATDYRAGRSVCIRYATNPTENEVNLDQLTGYMESFSQSVHEIREDESEFRKRLEELLFGTGSPADQTISVTFDISVAANRIIVKCLQALLESNVEVRIMYAEAEIYHPTKQEYEDKKIACQTEATLGLDYGVSKIEFSLEYPGNHLDPLPDHLAIFPTFNKSRSWAAMDQVDPSLNPTKQVDWLIGEPLHEKDRWRTDAMIEINELTSEMTQKLVSTFDYKESLRALESVHQAVWESKGLTVLPLGSKLQALAATIFCHMHRDVRLMYSIPIQYNASDYSNGCMKLWTLDLGPMHALRNLLSRVGSLSRN